VDNTLQLLGKAKKAGLLAIGGEAVTVAVRNRKAKLVVTATDASDGSVRRARISAELGGVIYFAIPYTKFELGSITGRGSPGTVAFLDAGLAAGFLKKLAGAESGDKEKINEAVIQLEQKAAARTAGTTGVKKTPSERKTTGKQPAPFAGNLKRREKR